MPSDKDASNPFNDPAWQALIDASNAELDAADEADAIAAAMCGHERNGTHDAWCGPCMMRRAGL